MLKVSVDAGELKEALQGIDLRAFNLEPQLGVIGEDIFNAIQDSFQSGNFTPLSDARVRYKLSKGKTAQPLIFDGTWKRQHHTEVTDHSVGVFTDVPYAVFHVSDKARSKIPLRNPYAFDGLDELVEDAANRLTHYIATGEIT